MTLSLQAIQAWESALEKRSRVVHQESLTVSSFSEAGCCPEVLDLDELSQAF